MIQICIFIALLAGCTANTSSGTHHHQTQPGTISVSEAEIAAEVGALEGPLGAIGAAGIDLLVQAISEVGTYLLDQLLTDHPGYKTVLGRAVIISYGSGAVSIQDVKTGLTFVGHGSEQEAMAEATHRFVMELYKAGFISIHDLHLAPSVATSTALPCGDNMSHSYCTHQKSLGHCSPRSSFYSFMVANCDRTCGCPKRRK